MLLSERETQADSHRLRRHVGRDHVIQSSFEQGNFFSNGPLKRTADESRLHLWWWYFDFSFPFPVYHSLIRSPHAVTCSIQLHLLKRPEMLLSIWNIAQTDCGSSSKENISVYCSEIKPLPQVPATISLFCEKRKKSPAEITNPLLVCSAAVIQRNKIISVAALRFGPRDKMINAQKYLFCWINPIIHSNRLSLF